MRSGLGHLGIQYATKMGYRVVALSSGPHKREDSLKFGAFAYLDGSNVDQAAELKKLGGAKVIMLCAPTSDVAGLLDGLTVNGTLLILAAEGHTPTPIPLCTSYRLLQASLLSWKSSRRSVFLSFAHAQTSFYPRVDHRYRKRHGGVLAVRPEFWYQTHRPNLPAR